MGLFKADLFRAFGVGFVLGGAALMAVLGSPFQKSIADQVIPSATAATASPDLPDQTKLAPAQVSRR